jgi:hypothetical protein
MTETAHPEPTPPPHGGYVEERHSARRWIAPIPDRMVDRYLGLAEWWRRRYHDGGPTDDGGPTAVKQIVVCDPTGRFPWDHGCQHSYRSAQALLLPQIVAREPSMTVSDRQGGASATG